MGLNCCSNEKEPPEITIYKPENNYLELVGIYKDVIDKYRDSGK